MDLISLGRRIGVLPQIISSKTPKVVHFNHNRDLIIPGIPGEPRLIVAGLSADDIIAAAEADPAEADWLDKLIAEMMVSHLAPFVPNVPLPRPSDNGEGPTA